MTVFAQSALATLGAAARRAVVPLELVLHRGGTTDFERRLAAVARVVVEGTGGAVSLRDGDGEGPPGLPALTVAAGDRRDVHYLAVPEGSEAPPFLDLLLALAQGQVGPRSSRQSVPGLEYPAELTVFMAPGCPNCPHAVRAALMLAAVNQQVRVAIVDATEFPVLAERFGVRSVPATVIDGTLSLTGVVPMGRLAQSILERGGPAHARAVLASMTESGRFSEAAERLHDGGALEHFADLWRESTLEQRIGLMLAAERALERDPRTLDDLVPRLAPALASDDRARRGDTADLLGRIGTPAARVELEALLDDPDPEVVEAAADALAGLR